MAPMIRAAKLDRRITIERHTKTVDQYRQEREAWIEIATVWAELLTQSEEEFRRPFGEEEKAVVGFRIRHLASLTTKDRVLYRGEAFSIRRLQELGNREGFDLMCEAVS